jgi:DNA-binding NarL/FixJ family response regulator
VKTDATWGRDGHDHLIEEDGPADEAAPIRLVLVEPRAIHAAGVRELLERESDIEVVAQVRTTDEAAGVAASATADVVVIDVDLPNGDSVEDTRRLKRQTPNAAFVILGREADDDSVFRAVQAGATAHVADGDGPAELVDAIRRVADGQDPLVEAVAERPAVVQRVADAYRELAVAGGTRSGRSGPVSPRQLEILRLVARGMSNDEIASALEISRQTVKNHLTAAMRTLGAKRRGQAVASALRGGWLSLRP